MATKSGRTGRVVSARSSASDDRRFFLLIAGVSLAILIALGLFYGMQALSEDDEASVSGSALSSAPADFVLPNLQGESVSLADYRGNYVLVNFWASWCPPCTAELPHLTAYYQAHADDGFVLLGVNVNESAEVASNFLRQNGYNFPVVLDERGAVQMRYGVSAYPSSFLIDPNGNMIKTWEPGIVTPDMLARDVTPLLEG